MSKDKKVAMLLQCAKLRRFAKMVPLLPHRRQFRTLAGFARFEIDHKIAHLTHIRIGADYSITDWFDVPSGYRRCASKWGEKHFASWRKRIVTAEIKLLRGGVRFKSIASQMPKKAHCGSAMRPVRQASNCQYLANIFSFSTGFSHFLFAQQSRQNSTPD